METPFKKLYDRLPVSLQNLAVTGFSVFLDRHRYGGRFKEFRDLLERSQWYSTAEIEQFSQQGAI